MKLTKIALFSGSGWSSVKLISPDIVYLIPCVSASTFIYKKKEASFHLFCFFLVYVFNLIIHWQRQTRSYMTSFEFLKKYLYICIFFFYFKIFNAYILLHEQRIKHWRWYTQSQNAPWTLLRYKYYLRSSFFFLVLSSTTSPTHTREDDDLRTGKTVASFL